MPIMACNNSPKESKSEEKVSLDSVVIDNSDVEESADSLRHYWQDDPYDNDVKQFIKVDSLVYYDKKGEMMGGFWKYHINETLPVYKLFNSRLSKIYSILIKEMKPYVNQDNGIEMPRGSAFLYNDLKFLSENALSIKLSGSIYGGGAHNEDWNDFLNYVYINNELEELSFKDLFKPEIQLELLNYDLETDSIYYGLTDEYSNNILNFGNKYKDELDYMPIIEFSFAKGGICIQFHHERYPIDLQMTYEDVRIVYAKLKPYMRPELYEMIVGR